MSCVESGVIGIITDTGMLQKIYENVVNKNIKQSGPKTDPCGTPILTSLYVLYQMLILALCFIFGKCFLMSLRASRPRT